MITREITRQLLASAEEYPVVTILGPRQSGKTTLVKMTFPNKVYYSLEAPDIRAAAAADPRGFLAQAEPNGMILDEIQRLPELLSYIQVIVDERRIPGSFILTGSHQPRLHEAISQSLAGRTALLTLWPFSFPELSHYGEFHDAFELMVKGFFPGLYEESLEINRFFESYLQTYVERDVRALTNIQDLLRFQRFLALLAGRTGQLVNYTALSNDVGVAPNTISNWISVLKASYVVFELPPYFPNVRKRVVKTPKIFFTDVGLASYLLEIQTVKQAMRDPLRGNLYENLVITEILKGSYNRGRRPQVYFYRDSHGNEVDLIIKYAGQLLAVEIKSASTFTPEFLKGLEKFKTIAGTSVAAGFVLYNGVQRFKIKNVHVFNPLFVPDIWEELTGVLPKNGK